MPAGEHEYMPRNFEKTAKKRDVRLGTPFASDLFCLKLQACYNNSHRRSWVKSHRFCLFLALSQPRTRYCSRLWASHILWTVPLIYARIISQNYFSIRRGTCSTGLGIFKLLPFVLTIRHELLATVKHQSRVCTHKPDISHARANTPDMHVSSLHSPFCH